MKRQQGFTFVELVIVVVILGLLAATALPRFIDITDEAERAATEGVAGGFASAVGITRAQWEVDFRPENSVVLDGTQVAINQFGYPSGGVEATAMTGAACQTVFQSILQSRPTSATSGDLRNVRYYISLLNGVGGSVFAPDGTNVTGIDLCAYHGVSSLTLQADGSAPATLTGALDDTFVGAGFTYNPGSGQVVSFSN